MALEARSSKAESNSRARPSVRRVPRYAPGAKASSRSRYIQSARLQPPRRLPVCTPAIPRFRGLGQARAKAGIRPTARRPTRRTTRASCRRSGSPALCAASRFSCSAYSGTITCGGPGRRSRARRGARTRADRLGSCVSAPPGRIAPALSTPLRSGIFPSGGQIWKAPVFLTRHLRGAPRVEGGHPCAVFLELVGKRAGQALADRRCRATPRPSRRRCVHAVRRSRDTGAAGSCRLAGPPFTPRPGASGAQSTPPRLWRPPGPTTCRTGPDLSARGGRAGAGYISWLKIRRARDFYRRGRPAAPWT